MKLLYIFLGIVVIELAWLIYEIRTLDLHVIWEK